MGTNDEIFILFKSRNKINYTLFISGGKGVDDVEELWSEGGGREK